MNNSSFFMLEECKKDREEGRAEKTARKQSRYVLEQQCILQVCFSNCLPDAETTISATVCVFQ